MGEQEVALEVDVDNVVPLLLAVGFEFLVDHDAVVADKDVHRAERLHHVGHHGVHGRFFGYVARERPGRIAYLRRQRLSRFRRAVHDRDLGALFREAAADGLADALRAARDDGDLVF